MSNFGKFADVAVDLKGHVATGEIQRPPHNYFDVNLVRTLVDAFRALDLEESCRAIVLVSKGRSFCAGAQLGGSANADAPEPGPGRHGSGHLYQEAVRLFETETPVVAAIQGAAIGGGFGLALVPDFRVACPEARFSSNFARLGFHQGFGLTVTLPELIGKQAAANMLLTGRRVKGEEAYQLGLCDHLVSMEELRPKATELALEIAGSAPLAVRSIRRTLRRGLADRIRLATDHELVEQDCREGVRATAERREPDFHGN